MLPLLSFATVCTLLISSEWTAREVFDRTKTNMLDCLVVDDPATGVRGIPNCVVWQKVYEESGPTEYRLNSRGHRAGTELLPKEPGTFRIVMVGSSIAEGMRVPREQSLAALLPRELTRETGRKVELYNEGMMYGTPHRVDLAFRDALNAQPDMILWIVTPWDIANAALVDAPWAKKAAGLLGGTAEPKQSSQHLNGFQRASKLIIDTLDRSRTVIMLRHFLYQSPTLYVRSYLRQEEGGQFMRSELSAAASAHLRQFATYAADIEREAAIARVPLVVTFVPEGAQATMISMGKWPAGFDPYGIGKRVRSVVESEGGTYVDILEAFQHVPEPQRFFMPVDGHPTAEGQQVLTALLAKALTTSNPALRSSGTRGYH